MAILIHRLSPSDPEGDYYHYCPGCKQLHLINTVRSNRNNARWNFNGNMLQPSFNPSIHIFSTNAKNVRHTSCHYFIIGGQIQYCPDSRHEFSGKTIPLPEIPEGFL